MASPRSVTPPDCVAVDADSAADVGRGLLTQPILKSTIRIVVGQTKIINETRPARGDEARQGKAWQAGRGRRNRMPASATAAASSE